MVLAQFHKLETLVSITSTATVVNKNKGGKMYGKIAFDAYRKAKDGIAYNNEAIPEWDALRPDVVEAWTAAGEAVRQAVEGDIAYDDFIGELIRMSESGSVEELHELHELQISYGTCGCTQCIKEENIDADNERRPCCSCE